MGKKILLADDSITIQKVIELTFSDEDFDVTTVGNGRLAIEKAEELRPDLMLCDIIMPEKDGYEVCEHIKKSPGLAHIPVLLLTGAFEPFDEDRANRVGADGYLAKPFEPQALVARVKELLEKAASGPAPAASVEPASTAATPSSDFSLPPTSKVPVIPASRPRTTGRMPVVRPGAGAKRPTFSGKVPVVPGRSAGPPRRVTMTGRVPVVPAGVRPGAPPPPRVAARPPSPPSSPRPLVGREEDASGGAFIPDEVAEAPVTPWATQAEVATTAEVFAEPLAEVESPLESAAPETDVDQVLAEASSETPEAPLPAEEAPLEPIEEGFDERFEEDWDATRRFDTEQVQAAAAAFAESAVEPEADFAPEPVQTEFAVEAETAEAPEVEFTPDEPAELDESIEASAFAEAESPRFVEERTFAEEAALAEVTEDAGAELEADAAPAGAETEARPYYSAPGEQVFEPPDEELPPLKLAQSGTPVSEGGAFQGEEVPGVESALEAEPELELGSPSSFEAEQEPVDPAYFETAAEPEVEHFDTVPDTEPARFQAVPEAETERFASVYEAEHGEAPSGSAEPQWTAEPEPEPEIAAEPESASSGIEPEIPAPQAPAAHAPAAHAPAAQAPAAQAPAAQAPAAQAPAAQPPAAQPPAAQPPAAQPPAAQPPAAQPPAAQPPAAQPEPAPVPAMAAAIQQRLSVPQELLTSAAASASVTLDVSDELVERIARRVVQHLSQRVLQDIAWDVVPDLAEELIKDEIARLKGQLEEV